MQKLFLSYGMFSVGWLQNSMYLHRGSYMWSFHMKFIKQAFGEFNKFNMKWTWNYDLLNAIQSTSKFVYYYSRQKCYVTCGHNIIYDMTLPTE